MPQIPKPLSLKERLAKSVCLFLAEMLRTRQVSLDRSAEIAARIVDELDRIGTEMEFLSAVQKMEFEFQELQVLHRDLLFYHHVDDRSRMEELVRQYAIEYLPDHPKQAVEIMEEALKPETKLEDLVKRFAQFGEFVKKQEDNLNKKR